MSIKEEFIQLRLIEGDSTWTVKPILTCLQLQSLFEIS